MATEPQRRKLLRLMAGTTALGVIPASLFAGTAIAGRATRIYSAASSPEGQHFLCAWSDNRLLFQVQSPGRGHDVILNKPANCAIYFARRPGNWFVVLDANSGDKIAQVRSHRGRHFYGHGALSNNGHYLFTTENDYEQGGRGVIGIYDCRDNFKRLGEYASGGIGPHQLAMLPDSQTLVIANGGILTLPDNPRENLNIDTMQPSLTYLDTTDGKALGSWRPPHHQLSLRHLDVDAGGLVTVGAQFEGPKILTLPLLFSHRGEQALTPYRADDIVWRQHKHYIASVACADGKVLATSPRGNCIGLWQGGELLRQEKLGDVAGAAYDTVRHQFVTSNGRGQFVSLGARQLQLTGRVAGLQWDNHMSIAG